MDAPLAKFGISCLLIGLVLLGAGCTLYIINRSDGNISIGSLGVFAVMDAALFVCKVAAHDEAKKLKTMMMRESARKGIGTGVAIATVGVILASVGTACLQGSLAGVDDCAETGQMLTSAGICVIMVGFMKAAVSQQPLLDAYCPRRNQPPYPAASTHKNHFDSSILSPILCHS